MQEWVLSLTWLSTVFMIGSRFSYLLFFSVVLQLSALAQNPFEVRRRPAVVPLAIDSLAGVDTGASVEAVRLPGDTPIQPLADDILGPDSDWPDRLLNADDHVDSDELPVLPADTLSTAEWSMPTESESAIVPPPSDPGPPSANVNVQGSGGLDVISMTLYLLLLAALLAVNRSILRKAYRAISNDNYLRFLLREHRSDPWIYWLFVLYFVFQAGFFVYKVVGSYWINLSLPLLLLICSAVVGVALVMRLTAWSFLGTVFPVDKETALVGFVFLLLNICLGVILTPVNLLLAFGPEHLFEYWVWLGAGLIILFYLFRQLKGLFISCRIWRTYGFHFFLYLCTVEIAPVLIIGKLVSDQL